MLTTDKQQRKERPIARGVLGYFPDAIAEVAHVSFVGNQQHNPGEPMHWARGKSDDHSDCAARHLIEAGTIDTDGLRHTAKLAWRALAMLQLEMEEAAIDAAETVAMSGGTGLPAIEAAGRCGYIPDNTAGYAPCTREKGHGGPCCHATIDQVEFFAPEQNGQRLSYYSSLIGYGCPPPVARQIVDGTSFTKCSDPSCHTPFVYIAGPMRGYEKFNFPAFDAARARMLAKGFNVISPADIDRATHPEADNVEKVDVTDQTTFAFRDFWALYFLAKLGHPQNGVMLLSGWEESTGAAGEFFLSRWIKLKFYNALGNEYVGNPVHDYALANAVLK